MNKKERRRLFGTEEEIEASLDYHRKILNAVEAAYGIKHEPGLETVRMNYYKNVPTGQYKAECTVFHKRAHWYAWGKTEAKAWEALFNIIRTEFRSDMNRKRKALRILD